MKSISKQFTLIFTGIMAATILLCLLSNALFLGRVYTGNKVRVLKSAYDRMDEATTVGDLESDAFDLQFQQITSTHNLDILILDTDTQTIKTSLHDTRGMTDRLIGYFFMNSENAEILFRSDKYSIQRVNDNRSGMEFLELWGLLSNGNLIGIRSPMESIRDSASIANHFLLYVGICAIIISGILIMLISKRVTRPILELTNISERMTNLDFDAKFDPGKGKNEITALGNNINTLSESLEKTISELKTANNELKQDIERKTEIDEMRKEFISNVSHELKTPIALVQGYAEGLKDCVNDDEESRDYYCEVIMDEAGKMNKLVQNLLTLDQLENGREQIEMERLDIVELIRNCAQSVNIMLEQNEIDLIFNEEGPIYVWSDEFKTEQVVNNYLSNAIHYAKGDKRIEISLTRHEDKLRVNVFNTGNPIPEESLDRLWTKFYKVDKARTREYGGSGIGLSIVKAICDSLNQGYGVINYDNGVSFWFDLDAEAK